MDIAKTSTESASLGASASASRPASPQGINAGRGPHIHPGSNTAGLSEVSTHSADGRGLELRPAKDVRMKTPVAMQASLPLLLEVVPYLPVSRPSPQSSAGRRKIG